MPFSYRIGSKKSPCRCALVMAAVLVSGSVARADEPLTNIHTVAVVSILGDIVDMQTIGFTKFDYADYKLHIDPDLDDSAREYVTKAIASHFSVHNDAINAKALSGADETNVGDRLQAITPKPDVDAVVVVYPNVTDDTGFIAHDLAVTYEPPFLFRRNGITTVAASFAVAIFDAKTGRRLNYGTGRYPDRGYLTGYSPPWERCSDTMWADSEEKISTVQKTQIRQELWSLLSRGLPYALGSAGLITASEVQALAATAAPAGDPSCHAPF